MIIKFKSIISCACAYGLLVQFLHSTIIVSLLYDQHLTILIFFGGCPIFGFIQLRVVYLHADFIVDTGADLPDDDDSRRVHRRPLLPREDDQEDVEALERSIQARYARSSHTEYDEETTDVEQQALLPSVRDPKLWMVKCAV